MLNIKHMTVLILLSFSVVAFAVDPGETYFSFSIRYRSEIDSFTKIISIDKVKGTLVFAYATDKQFETFKKSGHSYTILTHPGKLYTPKMSLQSNAKALSMTTYPTYPQYVAMMQQFASTYPSLCAVENIGTSVNGRSLIVAKISSNVAVESQKPRVFLTSTMHGEETAGYIILLKFVDYLLANSSTIPRVTTLLNNLVLYVNPLANPDGTYYGGDNTVYGARHLNANGIDLNRNMPQFTSGLSGDNQPFQLETQAMINFADQHSIILSFNFHGGAEVVNYPWDTDPRRHADDAWFFQISLSYASAAQQNGPPGYFTDVSANGVIDGWDWYEAVGTRQDYMTYWKRGREVTIELSEVRLIPEADFDNYFNYNRDAIFNYIEAAQYGVRGTVTDASTGQPLAASIEIAGHDVDRSGVWTNSTVGDYHRFLAAGTYTLTARAVGYTPRTFNNISIVNQQTTTLNITLSPASNPATFIVRKTGTILAGMNQTSGDLGLHGISQTSPYDRGLRFEPQSGNGATIDNDGNLTCSGILSGQASFLDSPANLTGGLVVRDNMGVVVAHVSAGSVVRARGQYLPGFSVQ